MITARLSLRELAAQDAPFVVDLMNDPSFIEFIGDRGVRTIADAQRYIENGPWTQYDVHGFGLWLVELREDGTPIGICGLLKRDALPAPDIGFAFGSAYRSQGYAFEAASAVKALARERFHASSLLAIVSPSNARSIRLLERLGFTFDRMVTLAEGARPIALYAVSFDTMPPR
jgi:ribosomal-protein-alanine N-acetyltransferase